VLAGRYEIQAVLGSGGMASVYRARDGFLNREVAIKVMAPWLSDDESYSRRFSEEARAAAGLSHPNIVIIYDTLEEAGRRYIVMEVVDGQPLDELMPLEEDRAVDIARQLASALEYAHDKGIIHCDIKPQNVLIEASGRPKLLDFGIARAATQTWAMATTVLGTAAYMAPEVVEGRRPDARSDVYSLATVLYEMISGRLPFEADSAAAQTAQRLVTDPLPLSKAAKVSTTVEEAVKAALSRDPDRRPQTAAEFAARLGQTAGPAQARVTSPIPVTLPPREVAAREAAPAPEPFTEESPPPTDTEPAIAEGSAGGARRKWLLWPLAALLVVGIFAGAFFAAGSLFADDDDPDYEGYFSQVQATFETYQSQHEQEGAAFSGQESDDPEANKQLYIDFLRNYVQTRTEFIGALQAIDPPEDLQDEHQAYLEAATAVVFALDDFSSQVDATDASLVSTLDISTFEQAEENQVRACNSLQSAATERGFELNLQCTDLEGAVQAPSFGEEAPSAAEEQPAQPTGNGRQEEDDGDGGDKGRGNGRGNGNDRDDD
jgi:serine/threonine protein kinase